MIVKSVIAGEYTAPPAHGPITAEICGITPEASVAEKDVGIPPERQHAFLNARPAGVVQPDDRCAHLHREIHDLHDLRGVRLGERTAEHREVLRERIDGASSDAAMARDDAVSGNQLFAHPEVAAAVSDELVDFLEGAGVEQEVDALARGELAGFVLPAAALVAAAQLRKTLELGESIRQVHLIS
jgi:hypothetical protein